MSNSSNHHGSTSSSNTDEEAIPNSTNDCPCTNNVVGSTINDVNILKSLEEEEEGCCNHKSTNSKPMQQTSSPYTFEAKELDRTQQLLETALIAIIQKYQTNQPPPQQQQQQTIPSVFSAFQTPIPVSLPVSTTINSPIVLQDMMSASGEKKAKESLDQVIILSLLSGAFVGFGAIASFKTGGNLPGWDVANPGFGKLIFSGVFTVGLMLVIVSGSELFTSNSMVMFVAMLRRKITVWTVARNLVLSLTFNLIGAFIVAYFFMYLPTTEKELHTAGFVTYAKKVGEGKVSRSPGLVIILGIGCNFLVCLAVYMTYASHMLVDKMISLIMPILAFVAGGFEHSVANAFFIPLAMLYGSPITMYDFLVVNLMPATLGNILGGAIFVGMAFWFTHGVRQENLDFFDKRFTMDFRAKVAKPILEIWDKVQAANPFMKKEVEQLNIELAEQKV